MVQARECLARDCRSTRRHQKDVNVNMHTYIVIFNQSEGLVDSTGRRLLPAYKIRCESEDMALLPLVDWFAHDFGEKDQQGPGCWRWYKSGNVLVVTVIRPHLLPVKSA